MQADSDDGVGTLTDLLANNVVVESIMAREHHSVVRVQLLLLWLWFLRGSLSPLDTLWLRHRPNLVLFVLFRPSRRPGRVTLSVLPRAPVRLLLLLEADDVVLLQILLLHCFLRPLTHRQVKGQLKLSQTVLRLILRKRDHLCLLVLLVLHLPQIRGIRRPQYLRNLALAVSLGARLLPQGGVRGRLVQAPTPARLDRRYLGGLILYLLSYKFRIIQRSRSLELNILFVLGDEVAPSPFRTLARDRTLFNLPGRHITVAVRGWQLSQAIVG